MGKKHSISMLGEVINDIAGRRKWQENLERHRLFSFWQIVVGKDIYAHARPKLLRGTVLWVDVTDSVWMQQLHFQKTEILESINARLKDTVVNDIRFKLVKEFPRQPEKIIPQKDHSLKRIADPEELNEFEAMISNISDQEVRESMKKLWLAQKSRLS